MRKKKNCMRKYTLYGRSATGPFSAESIDYSIGTHRWVVTVRAVSVKQAVELAVRDVQSHEGSEGVLEAVLRVRQTDTPEGGVNL